MNIYQNTSFLDIEFSFSSFRGEKWVFPTNSKNKITEHKVTGIKGRLLVNNTIKKQKARTKRTFRSRQAIKNSKPIPLSSHYFN